MSIRIKLSLLIVVIYIFQLFNVHAAIIKASSCSQADVKTAITSASDGDIVIIPGGSATWSESMVIKPMPSITIMGAGERTIITDATPTDGWQQSPFWLHVYENTSIRITNLTFRGKGGIKGTIHIQGPGKTFRIDNINFDLDQNGERAIFVHGASNGNYGVIDHCTFKHGSVSVTEDGDESWKRPYIFGSADAVFVEDCSFDFNEGFDIGGVMSGHTGARWVLRYTTITNAGLNNHGACTSPRSGMVMEIYNTTWNDPYDRGRAIHVRGGTGVIFDNVFNGYRVNSMGLTNYRSWTDGCGYDLGECDGSNPLDGNEDSSGRPCLDQAGRSANQTSEPLYEWNNLRNGEDFDYTVDDAGRNSIHIQEGRDYFNDTKRPNYTPYTYPHPNTYVSLLSPGSGDTAVAINAKLYWNLYLGAVSYGVLISKSSAFQDTVVFAENISNPVYSSAPFDSNSIYYWKVCAKYIKEINSNDSLIFDNLNCQSWLP